MDLQQLYDALAEGAADPGHTEADGPGLRDLALGQARTGDPAARFDALRVAGRLGAKEGLAIAHELVTDPAMRVRTEAFNRAMAAGADGLATIRRAAGGVDAKVAAAALGLLARSMDPQALAVAWRCLAFPDGGVRAAAVIVLGRIGSLGHTADLSRLRREDPDRLVRDAAEIAIARITGEEPRGEPEDWTVVNLIPEEAPPPVIAEPALPVPVTPDVTYVGASLPDPLPTEARALLRLLGMVEAHDRPAVMSAIELAPGWSDVMMAFPRQGGDPALGRGLACSAAALGRSGSLVKLSTMLKDADASIRAAAAEAIGALGTLGTVPSLADRFTDADMGVVVAAIEALGAIAARLSRPDLLETQLSRLPSQEPEAIAHAVTAARHRAGIG